MLPVVPRRVTVPRQFGKNVCDPRRVRIQRGRDKLGGPTSSGQEKFKSAELGALRAEVGEEHSLGFRQRVRTLKYSVPTYFFREKSKRTD